MEYKAIIAITLSLLSIFAIFTAACAENSDSDKITKITLFYHRPDGDYKNWKIWSWSEPASANIELTPVKIETSWACFEIVPSAYPNAQKICLLPKLGQWEAKDDPNRFIDLAGLKNSEAYIVSGKSGVFFQKPDISPFIKKAFIDSSKEVALVLSKKVGEKELENIEFKLKDLRSGKVYEAESARLHEAAPVAGREQDSSVETELYSKIIKLSLKNSIKYNFEENLPPYVEVAASGFLPAKLTPRNILYSSDFYYDGELGYLYSPQKTVFRVFAPTAEFVQVLLYRSHSGDACFSVGMHKIKGGVWEASLEGDSLGFYYKYRAHIYGETFEALDPYSKCNTAHNGRALIIDDRTPVCASPDFGIDKAVIYEMHIRDFTIDEKTSVKKRGKFLGVAEENTFHTHAPKVATGIAHLLELGVNTIQILPFQDFENDETSENYNWGYMPVNYNSPDGWYASATFDSSRVSECKRMVDALHKNGLKVVMDVVYNHTAEGNELVRYSFNALAPNYYYRMTDSGEYWNGSGCGNEFKSESPMGRKFIVDSLKYWVSEYKIDGFRFDLMGLIDIETVCLIVAELKKIKPEIFIYGEPWAAGSTPISPTVKGSQRDKGFAVFNDLFRDAIKGSVWDVKGGYVQGTAEAGLIERGMIGSIEDFASSPLETINYCEAHDNRTLYDSLAVTTNYDKTITLDKLKRMQKLANLLVIMAQGVPFLHSGQEMLRTKGGDENSYNKPDSVNKIDWDWKIENYDVFEYTKKLIELRKKHPIFRLYNAELIRKSAVFLNEDLKIPVAKKCLAYMINRPGEVRDDWESALILVNPRRDTLKFILPEGEWHVYMSDGRFFDDSHRTSVSEEIELKPISAAILYIR